jgi:CheY-like chemotaxis protein
MPLRILLADDNPINREFGIAVLTHRGHQVIGVPDTRAALAAWKTQRFDVVLMDLQMAAMDDFEAAAVIRAQEQVAGRHTPIIAMVEERMNGHRNRCFAAGMDGCIAKPMRADEVLAALNHLRAA